MTQSHRTDPHTDAPIAARRSILTTCVIVLTVAAWLDASSAHAQAIGERNGNLTDADGRTLYTYDKDSAGVSKCNGGCAFAWPPFFAKDAATQNGAFSVITRADGRKQWARDGKPLYFYVGDMKAGDVRGDNHGDEWHVIKADAAQASSTRAPATTYKADDYGYYYKP